MFQKTPLYEIKKKNNNLNKSNIILGESELSNINKNNRIDKKYYNEFIKIKKSDEFKKTESNISILKNYIGVYVDNKKNKFDLLNLVNYSILKTCVINQVF